ncbi:MAG: 50S ribosomal protein L11 methyltransferase [Acidobacteria bacterium]|nr:50S ribosomal protein L11 methyltransferase [Acidobacteriota bacterium]
MPMAKETNWNETWQRTWQPSLVGDKWYLAPPWSRKPTPPGRIRLSMHAGNYFGNGDHPTTRMVLAAMESVVRTGTSFVDIGCGSGLLCIAAHRLGGARLAGCDLDPAAVGAARRRFRGARYTVGSTELYKDGEWDVCSANLALGVLEQVESDLRRIVKTGGTLLASGVLTEQRNAARSLFARSWRMEAEARAGDWLAFTLVKK